MRFVLGGIKSLEFEKGRNWVGGGNPQEKQIELREFWPSILLYLSM